MQDGIINIKTDISVLRVRGGVAWTFSHFCLQGYKVEISPGLIEVKR